MIKLVTSAVVVCSCLATSATVEAQTRRGLRPQSRRPVTSPYLNLLDRNRGIGSNYYRRVRPELEFRQNDARLSRSLNALRRQQLATQVQIRSQLSGTGHRTSFLNLGGYFPSARR